MSAAKQLAVNRFPLPMDVVNIVKDFAFDSIVTGFIKEKKREIVALFDQAVYSRNNTSNWVTENSEDWLFLFGAGEKQFESCNCSTCGNYLVALNAKVLCRCIDQDHEFDEDEQMDFDEEEPLGFWGPI